MRHGLDSHMFLGMVWMQSLMGHGVDRWVLVLTAAVTFCTNCPTETLPRACTLTAEYVTADAGVTPGYGDEVIFADGTFIDGSTSELSADGPIRLPYTVYCQGGTHWTHWALALESALEAVQEVE